MATAGANSVKVTWTAAAANGTSITAYVVTAKGGAGPAKAVASATLTATLTGLPGTVATTITVAAVSSCGRGAVATSASVTPTGSATTFASAVLGSAPAAYYRLGEAAGVTLGADSSGKGALATYGSGATQGAAGALGTADPDLGVTVNGGCCAATAAPALPINDAARSVEAWVKPLDGNDHWIAGWGQSNTDNAFGVGVHGAAVIVEAYNDRLSFPLGASLVDGTWHDVVVTAAGSTVTAYVDGVSVGSHALAALLDTVNDSGLVIGAYEEGSSPFYGGLDEVAVYPSVLSASAVSAHFAATGFGHPPAPTLVNASDGADNEAVVSWAAGSRTTPPIARYVVTAITSGGVRTTSAVVGGTKTAARVTGLAGGVSYTFAVAAGNAYGLGPEAISGSAAISGPATPYAAAVAADAPAAYYRLGEALGSLQGADSSGRGHLISYSDVTLKTDGALPTDSDTAATADGNCCLGSAHPVLPAFDSARTVEFFVRPADSSNRWVLGWGRDSINDGFNIGVGDQTVLVSGYGDDLTIPTGRTLRDSAWHHIAVTYDRAHVTVYVDGTAVGTKAFTAALDTVDESGLQVGAALDGSAPYYGDLDEVAVYPTALSAARVQAHFVASGHAVPAAVTGLTATAGANAVTAHWTAAPAGPDPVTAQLVTVVKAGVRMNAVAVGPAATSATVTGLAGGAAVTVTVAEVDRYGTGPAATSAAVTPSGSATTYASSVIGRHPSVYYRLGEPSGVPIAADSSGAARPMTVGEGTYAAPGALATDPDTAASADGNCCLGSVAATLPAYDDARSVEAWVEPSDTAARWILGWGADDTDSSFDVALRDSQILVSAYGDDLTFQAPRSLVDGVWHHVVVTYNGTVAAAYLDGTLLGTKSFASALDTADVSTLRIGAYADGGGPFFGGLDDVAVYPVALSAAQVSADFAASGHGVPGAVSSLSVTAGANSAQVFWSPPTSVDPVTAYVVSAVKGGVAVNAVAVPGGVTSATLSGLAGGTSYQVRVTAVDAYGTGAAATSAAVTPSGAASTYATTVLANAPTAYYRFGDGTDSPVGADSSGLAHPASYSQDTLGSSGALTSDPDTAVTANGNCCVATAHPVLPAQNAARTVEAWVQPGDTSPRYVAGWGATSTRRGFSVGVQDSTVLVGSWGDDLRIPVGHTLVDGAWHHLVATYDGSTVTAYVDGVAIGSRTFAATLHTTAGTALTIGGFIDGEGPFYGGLDELAVYPTALSAAQVTAHFAASGHRVPTAPTGVHVTARANGITVAWTASTAPDGVATYLVTALAGTAPRNAIVVAGTATSAVLTGLPGGTAFGARVVAINTYGSSAAGTGTAVTPTGSATTYAASVLAQNPSAYYRLSEAPGLTSAADSSAAGRILPTTADGTFGASGAIVGDPDTAVTTDGGCCLGTTTLPLPAFNAARTVEAWVKPTDASARWFAGWGTDDTDRGFSVGTGDGTVTVAAFSDDLSFPVGHTLVDGAWHHIVVSYDGTAATAYVDGVALSTQTFRTTLNTVTDGTLRVGAFSDGNSPYYGGLDEVAIYPTALTAAQIGAHFSASGHRVPGAPTAVTATTRANGVNVSWTAPAAGPDGVNRYVVTALRGTTAINAMAVPGTATAAVLTGLPGGTAVTVRVTAGNAYGSGAAATSGSVTPTGSATTYASAVLTDAPIAYYRLGEPATTPVGADSSGKAALASYTTSATRGVTGALVSDPDKAATGDGGCCIAAAQVPGLPKFNAARSVEAWVKPADTGYHWFIGWGSNAVDRAFDVGVNDSTVMVAGYGDDLTFAVGHTLANGAWHHVVVTYDGTTVKAYIDGVALAGQHFQGTLNTLTNGFLRIGAAVDGSSPINGGLDEVAIYPVALTATQVSNHYAAK